MPSRTRSVASNRPDGGTMRPASTPSAASRVSISSRTGRSPRTIEHEREHERQPELLLVHVAAVGPLVEAAHGVADDAVALLPQREPRARRRRAVRVDLMDVMLELVHHAHRVAEGAP